MKIAILLHSTTGNTRLVTRYSAAWLERAGHEVEVFDIVELEDRGLPLLDDADLLGVACPTMYFRPTFAMERAIARLAPRGDGDRPAFLLATCMGEPGAHFAICAEQLRYKGWVVIDAKWVQAPSSWPVHFNAFARMERTTPVGTWLNHLARRGRPLWGTIWPLCVIPDEGDRRELESWLGRMLARVEGGCLERPPAPASLHEPLPGCGVSGRLMAREHVERHIGLEIDPERCSRCGTCAKICPVGAIEQPDGESMPRLVAGCTGCYACMNHCPEAAFSALGAPLGTRQYTGPPRAMREIFRKPRHWR